jgi:RNA polymerase sigma-70 factor, ECF subfamily
VTVKLGDAWVLFSTTMVGQVKMGQIPNPAGLTTEQLVDRFRRGDQAVLEVLFSRHREFLKSMVVQQLDGRASHRIDPSDIVQQTLLSAFRQINLFEGTTSGQFAAWLTKIHQRNIQDAFRRHVTAIKRSVFHERLVSSCDHVQDERLGQPSQQAITQEGVQRLIDMLRTLPADQALAIRLRHLDGWSLPQIAEQLNRSRDSVASLLKRGLENLRKRIDPE